MRAITRYLSCVRPGGEFETYFNKPKGLQGFLSDLFYFDFDVEFGAVWASFHVVVFGFGFKVAFNDPFVLSLSLKAPCADVRVSGGLTFDWERADVLREADEKRAARALDEAALMDVPLNEVFVGLSEDAQAAGADAASFAHNHGKWVPGLPASERVEQFHPDTCEACAGRS